MSEKQRCSPASIWAVDSTGEKNYFYCKISSGPFLTLGSGVAFAAHVSGVRELFPTGFGDCQVHQSLCVAACRFTVCWLWFSFALLKKVLSPFWLLPTPIFINDCRHVHVLLQSVWRGWGGYSPEGQSSCCADGPLNPGLVLRIKINFWQDCASAASLGHLSSATCSLFSNFWSVAGIFRIKNVSFSTFPYPLSWLV